MNKWPLATAVRYSSLGDRYRSLSGGLEWKGGNVTNRGMNKWPLATAVRYSSLADRQRSLNGALGRKKGKSDPTALTI
jgi:hypothetical protein